MMTSLLLLLNSAVVLLVLAETEVKDANGKQPRGIRWKREGERECILMTARTSEYGFFEAKPLGGITALPFSNYSVRVV